MRWVETFPPLSEKRGRCHVLWPLLMDIELSRQVELALFAVNHKLPVTDIF